MPIFGKGPAFGPPPQGVDLDPLIGLDDPRKPLRSRLLAVPSLKARYLEHVKIIAAELDWKKLGPVVAQYRALIEKEVEVDTRKLTSLAEFKRAIADAPEPAAKSAGRGLGMGLRAFSDQRSAFLLNYREDKKTVPPTKEEKP